MASYCFFLVDGISKLTLLSTNQISGNLKLPFALNTRRDLILISDNETF